MHPFNFDVINSITEVICSILMWGNVVTVYKDKRVNGIHWLTAIVFFLEYCWNVAYYIGLHQSYSIWAGVNIVVSNLVWIILAWKYRKKT